MEQKPVKQPHDKFQATIDQAFELLDDLANVFVEFRERTLEVGNPVAKGK